MLGSAKLDGLILGVEDQQWQNNIPTTLCGLFFTPVVLYSTIMMIEISDLFKIQDSRFNNI